VKKLQKKLALLLCLTLILTSLALGCNNAAQRPDLPRDQKETTDRDDDELSASERRVLASRLANLAEQVEGVKDATVVVSSIGVTNNLNAGKNIQPGINADDGTPDQNDKQGGINNNRTNTNQTANRMTNNQATNNANPNTVQTPPAGTNVSGLLVMVGLSLEEGMNTADKADEIKRTVANKLKASDKRISQVLVTTDPGLVQRLNDVAAGIIQGRPIQGYQEDINDLMRRMRQQQPAF